MFFFFFFENCLETFIKRETKRVQKKKSKKSINPRLNYVQLAKEKGCSKCTKENTLHHAPHEEQLLNP